MRILYTAPLDQTNLDLIKQNCGEIFAGIPEEYRLLDSYELGHLVNEVKADVLIVELNQVNAEVLEQARDLKMIGVCRSEVDNVDIDVATEKNILVSNTPSRNAGAVAEWTVGLMINLSRKFYKGVEQKQQEKPTGKVKPQCEIQGIELAGRTAGIIGLGRVGREVAKRLFGWDMKVIGYDPYVSQNIVEPYRVKLTSLEDLLNQSDFIIMLAALTKETQGMINEKSFRIMKPSSFLINSAQEHLVDEGSLLHALQNYEIAGAALDIYREEPLPKDSPWHALENVILTPHIGSVTQDRITRYSQIIYEDLLLFKDNKKPSHLINPDAWQGASA